MFRVAAQHRRFEFEYSVPLGTFQVKLETRWNSTWNGDGFVDGSHTAPNPMTRPTAGRPSRHLGLAAFHHSPQHNAARLLGDHGDTKASTGDQVVLAQQMHGAKQKNRAIRAQAAPKWQKFKTAHQALFKIQVV